MTTRSLSASAWLLLLCAHSASAATFCVGTLTELQDALTTAANNDQNDDVRLKAGTIVGGAVYYSTEPYSIKVSGGFNAICTTAPATTTLDGDHANRPLRIYNPNGDVEVTRIKFVNGLSTNNNGGGLSVVSTSGDIRIERNLFQNNRADDRAGGLRASTETGQMTIRNNAFLDNSSAAGGAVELFQGSGSAFVTSNTIFANRSDATMWVDVGGLSLWGSATYWLFNNIIWGHDAAYLGDDALDLLVGLTALHGRFNNDIGKIGGDGIAAFTVQCEVDVDPMFIVGGPMPDKELQPGSPLIDAGDSAPLGGLSALDLAGKPRIIGANIDIGAYENDDFLFRDGFE